MKPKFGWIYLSFVISLAVLIVVSVMFYNQFRKVRSYNEQMDINYEMLQQFIKMKEVVYAAETEGYGFMVTRDSFLLKKLQNIHADIAIRQDTLKMLLDSNSNQRAKLILMNSSLARRINTLNRNVYRVAINDTVDITNAIREGQKQSMLLRQEMDEIVNIGVTEGERIKKDIKEKQDITPKLFNVILMFSGLLTLVSFFFILREMRMRKKYQVELEKRINELNRSTAELEQFTYVASHDLQEPLRKIRTFSDRLVIKHKPVLNEEAGKIIDRIDISAHRMQDLIQDMVSFTTLVKRKEKIGKVDLNLVVNSVQESLYNIIEEKQATIEFDSLPVINGYRDQLFLLFRCLMENSLKFNNPDKHLIIQMNWIKLEGKSIKELDVPVNRNYYLLTFRDNGIGFDNEFASKIFLIFQRLHNQESHYHGKGIGLAIAQRVMTNHNGTITAKGISGEGAVFSLYFPIEEL
jgi:signal transduction histidine kinase